MPRGTPVMRYTNQEAIKRMHEAGLSNLEMMMVINSFKGKELKLTDLRKNLHILEIPANIKHTLKYRLKADTFQHLPCLGRVTKLRGDNGWRCKKCEYEFTDKQANFAREFGAFVSLDIAFQEDEE